MEENGDNIYLTKKGGMGFGGVYNYLIDDEVEGVILVLVAPDEGDTVQSQVLKNC